MAQATFFIADLLVQVVYEASKNRLNTAMLALMRYFYPCCGLSFYLGNVIAEE
ncbi:Uncharacterized protein YP598_3549 [Yersinia pseudotuberculosis]|uniref:Uncharacterized protein n=1 Tax=Yersinia pseudotuberculosis serotype O:1b (strain IP 31758) TaxID=349747 RepID=A0A0U1QUN8_YERP3|nr:hypothetical protein YpsIP31758_3471 [Yersinia pseudotuberculosis IP 31758]UFA63163.1 Uncharacterized protein YP598_3549 [Yersinia pseudotuberculosis]